MRAAPSQQDPLRALLLAAAQCRTLRRQGRQEDAKQRRDTHERSSRQVTGELLVLFY